MRRKRAPKTEAPHTYVLVARRGNKKKPTYIADPAKLKDDLPITTKATAARTWKWRNGPFNFMKRRPTLFRKFKTQRVA